MLVYILLVSCIVAASGFVIDLSSQGGSDSFTLHDYHNHNQLQDLLRALEEEDFVEKYRIGRSVQGREIDALKLSGGAGSILNRPLLKPMVKLVANMHGDESVGREIVLALAAHLTTSYGTDNRTTNLLDNVEVHLVPTMNPDGFEEEKRENNNGKDLNRNFPSWEQIGETADQLKSKREPETGAMIDWILENPFVLSINFHDGAVVANYPWDDTNMRPSQKSSLFVENGENNRTPDDKMFQTLAKLYAAKHSSMHAGSASCVDRSKFRDGVTNGVDWYAIAGGMQDFNYLYTNCMEITVELSCTKKPDPSKLEDEYNKNFEAMMSYLEYVERAVKGVVTDEEGVVVSGAQIRVEGEGKIVTTTDRGEYWRMLIPGKYRFKAVGNGKESEWAEVEVGDSTGPRVDLKLEKAEVVTEGPKKEETTNIEGVQVTLVPGWCFQLSLFKTPSWC